MKMINLLGQVFGRLTVKARLPNGNFREVRWECLCTCGNITNVSTNLLRRGKTKSCGCLMREFASLRAVKRNFKHGGRSRPEYHNWQAIKHRCLNPNYHHWKDYGGRGITMYEAWQTSFEQFFEDVGPKPSPKHTIDRIDNDGNYEPGNVRWATPKEQSNNTRSRISNAEFEAVKQRLALYEEKYGPIEA